MWIIFQTPPIFHCQPWEITPDASSSAQKFTHCLCWPYFEKKKIKISVSAPDNCTEHTPLLVNLALIRVLFSRQKRWCFCNTAYKLPSCWYRHFEGEASSLALILLSLTPRISLIKSIFPDISYCCSNVRTSPLCALMLMLIQLQQLSSGSEQRLGQGFQMKNTQLPWGKANLSPTNGCVCKQYLWSLFRFPVKEFNTFPWPHP